MKKYSTDSTSAVLFTWLARQMKKSFKSRCSFQYGVKTSCFYFICGLTQDNQTATFSNFPCLVTLDTFKSKTDDKGRALRCLPIIACWHTKRCNLLIPIGSPLYRKGQTAYTLTGLGCEIRVRSAPRSLGRCGICCWTVGQKKVILLIPTQGQWETEVWQGITVLL